MKDAPETRQSLLMRLRDPQDQQAWEEFVSIYEPLIYRLASKKGFQDADASDVTQDVLTSVSRAVERFDLDPDKGSFRGWLNRITRNLMINFLSRRKGPLGTGETAMLLLLDEQAVVDDEATALFELEYRRECFRQAAQRVRNNVQTATWQSFWLTAVEGQSSEQAAEKLGKSAGAVRIARCRVLAKLKLEVAKLSDADE